jgi:hypothetical protein
MDPNLRYPEWQQPCVDALAEVDPKKLPERVTAAKSAIARRVQELASSRDGHEERRAMNDALNVLRFLEKDQLRGLEI